MNKIIAATDYSHNFSAGPSMLPDVVKQKFKSGQLSGSKNIDIFEISHRSPQFLALYHETIALLRQTLKIPANFEVVFVHGGATMQFSMIPINFNVAQKKLAYVDTGVWASKAISEAELDKNNRVEVVASSKYANYSYIPKLELDLKSTEYAYLHITSNNTIYGTQYKEFPKLKDVPLFVDMSSDIFSYPLDFDKVALVYGSNQKNFGISGLGFAIIRKDLLERTPSLDYSLLKYKSYVEKESMFNTPNTSGIYIAKLVLEWIIEKGGVDAMRVSTENKAQMIYSLLDKYPDFYQGNAQIAHRSNVNVVFKLPNKELEQKFLAEAEKNNLLFLKGHRIIGGIRASIYNAMELESVEALSRFMHQFHQNNK